MNLEIREDDWLDTNETNSPTVIKVVGVGGGGNNAANRMISVGLSNVEFIAVNTDLQALQSSKASIRMPLGAKVTGGLGAGGKPEVGEKAAQEDKEELQRLLDGADMVFITAGMGGGTGTGGAPVIAEACSAEGYLTVGIVTIPFRNEGKRRIKQAIDGIMALEGHVDALLVINNERIREMYGDFGISEAFSKADNVLAAAAKGIAEIITVPGYINVDFADVETVMRKSGLALMGSGVAGGEDRATEAVEKALNSPLLNNNDIRGAKNILLNITSGSQEVTMDEVGRITDYLQNKAGFEADLIWGNGRDDSLGEEISVTLIATGFGSSSIAEITGERTVEKETHELNTDNGVPPKDDFVNSEKTKLTSQSDQQTFEFNQGENKSSDDMEFEVLYPQTNRERKKSAINSKMDFASASEEDLDELENIPAYKRRQLRMNDPKYREKFSKYSVDSENKLSDKNSYLHSRVD